MTMKDAESLPLPRATAIKRIEYFQDKFNVADENAAVTEQLLHLLKDYDFSGKKVHDANIVATMKVYDISCLLTNNIKDFHLFGETIAIRALTETA